jgi:hypothetical protein
MPAKSLMLWHRRFELTQRRLCKLFLKKLMKINKERVGENLEKTYVTCAYHFD